jgi:hypothetical protein
LRGKLPDAVVACVGGGSNAIGTFYDFVPDKSVRLIGVEAGGDGELHLEGCLLASNVDTQASKLRNIAPLSQEANQACFMECEHIFSKQRQDKSPKRIQSALDWIIRELDLSIPT